MLTGRLPSEHEYILCYAKDKSLLDKEWKSSLSEIKIRLVKIGEEFVKKHSKQPTRQAAYTEWFRENKHQLGPLDRYKYIDKGGIYTGSQSVHNPGREGYRYDVIHPVTKRPCKQPLMGYRFPPETMKALLAEKRILFGDTEEKIIELKVYAHEYEEKLPSVIELDGRVGAYELRELFPEKTKVFDNPKPVELISQLLGFTTTKSSLVLDSFAGSGTTAHAVLSLNAQDGGSRRFILVECEDYADELTAERVRRVIKGVSKSKNEAIKKGTGGSFTFCTLGEELNLDKILQGKQLPDFRTLGQWLFHTATGEALAAKGIDEKKQYLGESNGRHVWLIYKPDLEFLQSPASALTRDVAKAIAAAKPGASNLVFGPAKFISNKELASLGVEFVPLPFALYRVAKD